MSLKILWSLDPFEKGSINKRVARTLRTLDSFTDSIEPTYVLSPSQLSLRSSQDNDWLLKYEPAVSQAMDSMVKGFDIPKLSEPVILSDFKNSITGAVEAINRQAQKRQADLIVVSTHARKGLTRLFLGSFAESLILKSTASILCVNPKTQSSSVKRIVFSTDFSDRSLKTVTKLLNWAKILGAHVTFYHCIPTASEPVLQAGVYLMGGGWVPFSEYVESQSTDAEKSLKDLVIQAMEMGVSAGYHLDTKKPSVVDAVLKYAEQSRADWVALAVESNALEATFLGSIARQVVRSSSKPVLLLK